MRDPRVTNLARILVLHSTQVKEGDVCTIEGESAAEPLLQAVYEEVLQAGGNLVVHMALEGQSAAYFEHASDAQLEWISPVAEWAVENADVRIAVMASQNTRALSAVPPERQAQRQAATQGLMKRAMERSAEGSYRWALTLFPTHAYASEAGMSLEAFEDFYFGACLAMTRTRWGPGSASRRRPSGSRSGSRGGARSTCGARDRPPAGDRGSHLHRRRRKAQHARRRVLHRPGRGLGRG